jgi:hypothetical protein
MVSWGFLPFFLYPDDGLPSNIPDLLRCQYDVEITGLTLHGKRGWSED